MLDRLAPCASFFVEDIEDHIPKVPFCHARRALFVMSLEDSREPLQAVVMAMISRSFHWLGPFIENQLEIRVHGAVSLLETGQVVVGRFRFHDQNRIRYHFLASGSKKQRRRRGEGEQQKR
jgi:hypothetical protein